MRFIRDVFISEDTPPGPVGTATASHGPPMVFESIRTRYHHEARPSVTPAALRSAAVNAHRGTDRRRFDLELFDYVSPCRPGGIPSSLVSTSPPHSHMASSQLSYFSSASFVCDSCDTGPPFLLWARQYATVDRLKRAHAIDKIAIVNRTIADSTRGRYKYGRDARCEVCNGAAVAQRLEPTKGNWGGAPLDFPTWDIVLRALGILDCYPVIMHVVLYILGEVSISTRLHLELEITGGMLRV